MLGRVDDRDGDLRGRDGLRVHRRTRDVAGLGVLNLHGEVVAEGDGNDSGEHEGGRHRGHYHRDADDSERHVLALLTLAQETLTRSEGRAGRVRSTHSVNPS